ncbi:bromodomain-containing factor 1 isoform X2 [Momordica charantia]|uniref:Bromodomain-containing factor 1 isoform X2 n=1 Tax=Momordica charantia TaxID=3673 RepID=A0A6J1DE88_MOMCH|nr:bromodomain-containing factor 1 isoform X2 [Momordica charantia]
MKRKRGNKKSKRKGVGGGIEGAGKEAASLVTEDNSGLEEFDNDNKSDSAMDVEVDTPSSTGTDHLNVANVNPDDSIDKAAGKSSVGRVKVKLRTSKMMDAQINSSDAPTQSDTDKSSLQMGLEKHSVVSDKMEDSANSLPEKESAFSGTASKKIGSIKIKSSKSFGAGNNSTSNASKAQAGNRMPQQDSRPNKTELDTALTVIKKVMKMDAAEPFNVPVNPVALGIPDYFDVIDTPMDFGTICSNLENGDKYMNSEDVFKDVQYIWENCYRYNNKGDYILDLMRRVKKNFSKYWTAAGLYNGQGVDITQENGGPSSQVKSLKGQSKQKTKKRHGRRHKSDCLCAICVLKRRRKEREEIAKITKDQIGAGNNQGQEFKIEESLRVDSPGSLDSSSNADDSVDNELDVEEETGDEVKMDVSKQQFSTPEEKQDEGEEEKDGEGNETEMKMGVDSKGTDQSESRPSKSTMEQSGDSKMEDVLPHEEGQQDIHELEHKEVEERRKKKLKAWEELSNKNPMLLELCGVVFPVNPRSVWRGPHSLLPHQHQTSRISSIHMAIDKFMK